jgi:cytochrome b subunit of formate dehydrogenase
LVGVRYTVTIALLAIILASVIEAFGRPGEYSATTLLLNAAGMAVTFVTLSFVGFIVYRVSSGEKFGYLSLMFSASLVLFILCATGIARTAALESSNFHVGLVALALIASLAAAAILSAFVVVAQRFISA